MPDQAPYQTDLDMVSGALAGDQAMIESILERFACLPAMVRSKNRRMGRLLGTHEEEDASQSAITALWAKLPSYNGKSPLETWAYGFCVLEIMKVLERRRGPRPMEPLEEENVPPAPVSESKVDAEAIAQALNTIGPPGNEVIRLKHFTGMIFEDIAERLNIPVTTAKTRYYRSLERLRTLLANEHDEATA